MAKLWSGRGGFQRRLVDPAFRKAQSEHLSFGVGLAGRADLEQAEML